MSFIEWVACRKLEMFFDEKMNLQWYLNVKNIIFFKNSLLYIISKLTLKNIININNKTYYLDKN